MFSFRPVSSGLPRRIPEGIRLIVVLALLFGCLAGKGRAAQFSASLERDTLTLGERTTLSLTFQGTSQQPQPSVPAVPGLQIASAGVSESSQVNLINGQASTTFTHLYSVVPTQVGEFTIPAVTVDVGGEKLTSPALKLKVLKPDAPSQESIQAGNQPAFLKLFLPKKEVYLGEIITGELQLYIRAGVQNIEQFQTTSFPTDGFSISKLVQGRQRQVQSGGITYTVIPLAFTLKAIKTGAFTVGPVNASVVVELPSRNRRRDPVFDMLDMFNSGERRQVILATTPEQTQILALPSSKVPPGFTGAVGTFTMTSSAAPTNVAVGDPITLKVQIAGRGPIDALTLPEQPWKDFKAYPPTAKVDTADPFGIQGTKSFEQVIAPQSVDVKEVPAFTFSYFDPDQKAYRSLSQPPVKLVVRPAGNVPVPTVATVRQDFESPAARHDIVHIKPRPGTLAQLGSPLLARPAFLLLQVVPVIVLLAAFGWRKRAEHLANNPRLVRHRRVAVLLREGTIQLQRHAQANTSDEFFGTLFRLLQEQLGERLDLPASAITEAVIEERLQPRGISTELAAGLHELFQLCNLAKYAPVRSSQELAALIPKWQRVSNDLEELKS